MAIEGANMLTFTGILPFPAAQIRGLGANSSILDSVEVWAATSFPPALLFSYMIFQNAQFP